MLVSSEEQVMLLLAYQKNTQSDLTPPQLKVLWSIVIKNKGKVVKVKQTLFDQLAASVEQADAIMQGRQAPSRVTEYPEPQVKDIRAQTGLTQSGFAHVLGVSKRTLENWEQGRHQPTGPARTLLRVLGADPQYVLRTLNREYSGSE